VKERVLSTRELNRALLARQLLLKRSSLPLVGALEQVGGLQSQYAPSAYIGLWSRLAGFQRASLTSALMKRRAVQGTLMRSTIHVVSAADFPLLAAGIRGARREWWLRIARHQIELAEVERAAALMREMLSSGPRRATEIRAMLAEHKVPALAGSGVGGWIDLLRIPPSGTWEQRRADLFGLADDWLGPSQVEEAEGMEHVVRRYLGAFGPATLNDIAGWAGLQPTRLVTTVGRLDLRRFRDPKGAVLLDLRRAPIPGGDTPAPVRFLPTWDATLLVHARRTQILPEQYRPLVFDVKTPHSVPTFLIDGAVAGKWRYESGRVRLEPFAPLPRAARGELEEEARALAAFHAA
jgi:hypothetical protein